jgi:acetoin utilization deacetylase AcuC-like enzyme
MLKIAFDLIYADPLPEGHRFPMIKYELIPEQLLYEGVIRPENLFSPEPADDEIVLLTHDAGYWQRLKEGKLTTTEQRRIGFPWSASLIERELRIARGTVEASLFALANGVAFNVAGGTHHAGSN